jgi:SHS2 domain-containing protein
MKRFDIIEHTADIGIKAYGQTLAEAFENAAFGLFSIITDLRKVRKLEQCAVDLQTDSPEDLLYQWLNHLIYLFDAEQMLFKQCVIREFEGTKLKAVCYGERADIARHKMKTGVKAATYHQLNVDSKNNQVEVIFDI